MTRKDYILIAGAFKRVVRKYPDMSREDAVMDAVYEIADVLKSDNPRFDLHKFIDAVTGVKDKKEERNENAEVERKIA